jgi:hypothetical protein
MKRGKANREISWEAKSLSMKESTVSLLCKSVKCGCRLKAGCAWLQRLKSVFVFLHSLYSPFCVHFWSVFLSAENPVMGGGEGLATFFCLFCWWEVLFCSCYIDTCSDLWPALFWSFLGGSQLSALRNQKVLRRSCHEKYLKCWLLNGWKRSCELSLLTGLRNLLCLREIHLAVSKYLI